MDVNPGFKYIEKFTDAVHWYMMEKSKESSSNISSKFKRQNRVLVSFSW